MYFALVVDINIVFYFLLFYETIAPLRKKQYYMTNFQSSKSPRKLLSAYLMRLYGDTSLEVASSGL